MFDRDLTPVRRLRLEVRRHVIQGQADECELNTEGCD